MLLQAVHILSANILVVTRGYGFNLKWITKLSEFSWTIPTVKMKSLLNRDLEQCKDIFCCPQRTVMSHDLPLFYHNSLLYPKTLIFPKASILNTQHLCIVPTLILNCIRSLLWAGSNAEAALDKFFGINNILNIFIFLFWLLMFWWQTFKKYTYFSSVK